MQRTDKFLIGIVAGLVVLVGVGFAVMLLRPKPGYLPDDTPGGVANNYLLAIEREDYPRAYGYLSRELAGYPANATTFGRIISDYHGYGENSTATVTEVMTEDSTATVRFEQTSFYEGGLFGSGTYQNQYRMDLIREGGQWRISYADTYWAWCFDEPEGCN